MKGHRLLPKLQRVSAAHCVARWALHVIKQALRIAGNPSHKINTDVLDQQPHCLFSCCWAPMQSDTNMKRNKQNRMYKLTSYCRPRRSRGRFDWLTCSHDQMSHVVLRSALGSRLHLSQISVYISRLHQVVRGNTRFMSTRVRRSKVPVCTPACVFSVQAECLIVPAGQWSVIGMLAMNQLLLSCLSMGSIKLHYSLLIGWLINIISRKEQLACRTSDILKKWKSDPFTSQLKLRVAMLRMFLIVLQR